MLPSTALSPISVSCALAPRYKVYTFEDGLDARSAIRRVAHFHHGFRLDKLEARPLDNRFQRVPAKLHRRSEATVTLTLSFFHVSPVKVQRPNVHPDASGPKQLGDAHHILGDHGRGVQEERSRDGVKFCSPPGGVLDEIAHRDLERRRVAACEEALGSNVGQTHRAELIRLVEVTPFLFDERMNRVLPSFWALLGEEGPEQDHPHAKLDRLDCVPSLHDLQRQPH
eukprot:scaffold7205_cov239-Pinguiococcus_pyrenoidosus.AAC.1